MVCRGEGTSCSNRIRKTRSEEKGVVHPLFVLKAFDDYIHATKVREIKVFDHDLFNFISQHGADLLDVSLGIKTQTDMQANRPPVGFDFRSGGINSLNVQA